MSEGVGERGKKTQQKFLERQDKASASENIKIEEVTKEKAYKCSGMYRGLLHISKLYGHTGTDWQHCGLVHRVTFTVAAG